MLRGQLHYLLLNQQGCLRLFNQVSNEAVSLPASASSLAHKQFKNIKSGALDGRCQVLQGLDGQEVVVIGALAEQKATTTANRQAHDRNREKSEDLDQRFLQFFTKFDRIRFQVKIKSIAAGLNHVLALSELRQGGKVFSWGRGHLGQLGHDDTDDQAFPRHVKSLATYVLEVQAVGNTSLVLDELNQLRTFGSNEQGLLGDNSEEEFRPTPSKLGKQFLLQQVLMLRSG